ncbi:MAG: class I SAM-dependent methyltransferase [Phycisphaerae bacterium]|nr:class I SAM-dependent methyltransferase [Phycisphaerae bacterium]
MQLANDVANAISRQVTLSTDMDVLDFGCGTGLLTLRLTPLVKSITGVDSSRGMLNVLDAKIARQNLANVRTLLLDLEAGDVLADKYDLVVSNMTLHHIPDDGPPEKRRMTVSLSRGSIGVAWLWLFVSRASCPRIAGRMPATRKGGTPSLRRRPSPILRQAQERRCA